MKYTLLRMIVYPCNVSTLCNRRYISLESFLVPRYIYVYTITISLDANCRSGDYRTIVDPPLRLYVHTYMYISDSRKQFLPLSLQINRSIPDNPWPLPASRRKDLCAISNRWLMLCIGVNDATRFLKPILDAL